MKENFHAALAFVWGPGFDDPGDGFHVTPNDPGGGTKGGVIQATWDHATMLHIVTGTLSQATNDQLSDVLLEMFWGPACDALPSGIDLLLFNGRMMSGYFPKLFQQCLGMMGHDVDGLIGPATLEAANASDAMTLINAVSGTHYAYLTTLRGWAADGRGWTTRLRAAQTTACALAAAELPTPAALSEADILNQQQLDKAAP